MEHYNKELTSASSAAELNISKVSDFLMLPVLEYFVACVVSLKLEVILIRLGARSNYNRVYIE